MLTMLENDTWSKISFSTEMRQEYLYQRAYYTNQATYGVESIVTF